MTEETGVEFQDITKLEVVCFTTFWQIFESGMELKLFKLNYIHDIWPSRHMKYICLTDKYDKAND